MKMSDVFYLPLKVVGNSIAENNDNQVSDWGFDKEEYDIAAIHAINNHDALVELNKDLVDVLRSIKLMSCGTFTNAERNIYLEAETMLRKAKELL